MNEIFTAEEILVMRNALVSHKRTVSFSNLPQKTIEEVVKAIREVDTKLAALTPAGV